MAQHPHSASEQLYQLRGQRIFIWNAIDRMAWNSFKDNDRYEHLWTQWHSLRQTITQIEQQCPYKECLEAQRIIQHHSETLNFVGSQTVI